MSVEQIKKLKEEFDRIINKYNLSDEDKAEEIANFLTSKKNGETISAKDFATLFAMQENEAEVFLSFIATGLKFKKHTDKNK